MLRLAVSCADHVRRFAVPEQPAYLGSGSGAELRAPFPGVSRRHALVQPRPGGVLLTDLGSTNGLVVDGRRVAELYLVPGDTVRLGRAVLALEEISTADAEVALRLDGQAVEFASGSSLEVGTVHALAGAAVTADNALRFVRDLEATVKDGAQAPSREHRRRAGGALGADSLAVLHEASDDLAVVECAGPLPSEKVLAKLAAALGRRAASAERTVWLDRDGRVALLAAAPAGQGRHLVAVFGGEEVADPLPWQRDFFAYLADRFGVAPLAADGAAVEEPGAPGEVLRFPPGMVVGASAAMQGLLRHLRATLRSDQNVLLLGETGTGKELFARMIHASGPKARGPFVAINCAAIPSELLEAELFGVAGRVATGVDPRPGLFVQAHGGTVFLDEIGDMPERLQAKILRVLQEREVLPLGGASAKKVDARVIAASNRNLEELVARSTFRADLYYRLRGLQFHLPPLRDRREDLPELTLAFVARAAEKYRKRIAGVSRKALALLQEHSWPGNIRELENEVERAVLLCPEGGSLQSQHFGALRWQHPGRPAESAPPTSPSLERRPPSGATLAIKVDDVERRAIQAALAAAKGNKSRAARALGITRNGLSLKMRRLGLLQP